VNGEAGFVNDRVVVDDVLNRALGHKPSVKKDRLCT
jgi:hypothetical protein